jgi:cation diffusion facilitator family transporter
MNQSQGVPVSARRPRLRSARAFAGVSICASIVTVSLKLLAYRVTGSVGLLSDATESLVNVFAACMAFWMLTVAALPPDEEHDYGHTKAEYFASGLESMLVLCAAVGIVLEVRHHLASPHHLTNIWLGLGMSAAASCVNAGAAVMLFAAAKRLRSITLRADAAHLLTDVWTSAGVIAAVVLVHATGWLVLDPMIAVLVGANIIYTGARLLNDTLHGLLDTALPPPERQAVQAILDEYSKRGTGFHAFRSRMSGQRRFLSVHVLVPGAWTVQQGHDLVEEIERSIHSALPMCTITTHLEPMEDPAAFEDQKLDREGE